MTAGFRIDPADPRPIWRQIEENVRHLVASGALRPASPVPSVRDLARTLVVNPATVAKAYQRLTDAGVLAVRRGDGTYVSAAPPALGAGERERRLEAEALRFASLAATLGASEREAAGALDAAWRALRGDAGGPGFDGALIAPAPAGSGTAAVSPTEPAPPAGRPAPAQRPPLDTLLAPAAPAPPLPPPVGQAPGSRRGGDR
jgi:GntR family transcriptional regulator